MKVYETVLLPADEINPLNGLPKFLGVHKGFDTLGPNYTVSETVQVEAPPPGHPSIRLETWHITITRNSDNKLLGEIINYRRNGDERDTPFPPEMRQCQNIGGTYVLIKNIFKKE